MAKKYRTETQWGHLAPGVSFFNHCSALSVPFPRATGRCFIGAQCAHRWGIAELSMETWRKATLTLEKGFLQCRGTWFSLLRKRVLLQWYFPEKGCNWWWKVLFQTPLLGEVGFLSTLPWSLGPKSKVTMAQGEYGFDGHGKNSTLYLSLCLRKICSFWITFNAELKDT